MRRLLGLSFSVTRGVIQILRQQLLWMLLLRIVLYTLLLGVTYILSDLHFSVIILPNSVLILLLLSVYTISIVSALILIRLERNLQKFGFLQCILDTIFASLLVYSTGISNSIFTSVYFFSIITGGLLLPRRGGLIAAAAATISYGFILFLEFQGIVPDYFLVFDFNPMQKLQELVNLFAVKGLTFFLAALLSAMFGIRLHSTEEVLSDTIYSFDKLSHLYKTIFDNISTGIITTNDQHIITSANTAARNIIDYSLDELIGHDLTRILPHLNLSSRATRQAIDFYKKDGTKIRIGYSLTSLHMPSKDLSGKKISSIYEEDSKLVTLQDISEIEKLESKIRQGEKLAAIGMMSAGIAHDFRNPLTAISGSAQILAGEFSSAGSAGNKENMMLTNIILRESNRLISTIADFLKFARPDLVERYWFSLLNCIEEVLQVCRADPEWPETSTIKIDIDPRTDVWADEKQFFTIMNHLIQNSIAFCAEGQEIIRIRAREQTLSDDKGNLVISVEDNGPGIDKEMYEKIFEPFYTNRADGTGLGLTIVQQIVEGHKGSISISRSSLGGAKFTVTLPLY
ncbi:two-component system sensor histidine kinase NtrB [Desulfopila inferna]|uniref:two-component system sensor histidine kinase NtrB n=1 Tax=Desulfopila inferna TaxID=468528 RepID=UPI001966C100|nr:ATP-binding protein [Desulfopila inferna]MBM9605872.1 PAS domain S-box protein [Desulfopila inferna]